MASWGASIKPLAPGFGLALLGLVLLGAASGEAPTSAPPEEPLLQQIDRVLAKVRGRRLRSDRHTPWVILHGVIAFEKDLTVHDVAQNGELNAIEYLLSRATYEGRPIFREQAGVPTLPPRVHYFQVQDHVDQLLMALADADVSLDRELRADTGRTFTVASLLAASQSGFSEGQELGWTLVVLARYVPFDRRWTPSGGGSVGIEDIVRWALERDPRTETEGGSHHLYGVAYALGRYRAQGGALRGVWQQAGAYLGRYVDLARRHQQGDGAFSAAVFRGSRAADSPRQLVSTTGHMLEWLMRALPARDLREVWVERAVRRLTDEMLRVPLTSLSDGGLYHAAHALRLYREAVRSRPG